MTKAPPSTSVILVPEPVPVPAPPLGRRRHRVSGPDRDPDRDPDKAVMTSVLAALLVGGLAVFALTGRAVFVAVVSLWS